jgi:hypothetical protein
MEKLKQFHKIGFNGNIFAHSSNLTLPYYFLGIALMLKTISLDRYSQWIKDIE